MGHSRDWTHVCPVVETQNSNIIKIHINIFMIFFDNLLIIPL